MEFRINLHRIIEYIFVFSLILNFNSVFSRFTNMKVIIDIITAFSLLVLLIISFKKLLKNKNMFLLTSIICILFILYLLIFYLCSPPMEGRLDFILRFIYMLPCFVIYNISTKNRNEFFLKLNNLVYILAVMSLVFYFLGSILNIIKTTGSVFFDWGGPQNVGHYFFLHFNSQYTTFLGNRIFRNTSIFTESPMYSFLLSLALGIEFFIKEKPDKNRIIVIILSILTTFSSTGIFSIVAVLILNMFKKTSFQNIMVAFKKIGVLIAILIIFSIGLYFITDKINQSKTRMGSFSVRLEDYRIAFQILKDSFLFGFGYGNFNVVQQNYMSLARGYDIGGSNSLIILFANGGIYLSLIFIIPFMWAIAKTIITNYNLFSLISIILIIFLLTAIPLKSLSIFIVAWMISIIISKKYVLQ